MNINELTIGQLRDLQNLVGAKSTPEDERFFEIGKAYFLRTVTHHHIGRLAGFARNGNELVLTECSWVADDGRFTETVQKGILNEVEIFPRDQTVLVNRESLIDAVEWTHPIPTEQK